MQRQTASSCAFAKYDLEWAILNPGASEIRTLDMSIVAECERLMFVNTSGVGCGPGLSRIAHSQNGTSNRLYSPPPASEIRTADISTMAA
jgi:hypothetical protein